MPVKGIGYEQKVGGKNGRDIGRGKFTLMVGLVLKSCMSETTLSRTTL